MLEGTECAMERFTSDKYCIQESELWIYYFPLWLIRYPLKCVPIAKAGAHFTVDVST